MSTRAIQRLREEEEERKKQQRLLEGILSEEEEEESSDEESYNNRNRGKSTFVAYFSDDDDDTDSEDEEEPDDEIDDDESLDEDENKNKVSDSDKTDAEIKIKKEAPNREINKGNNNSKNGDDIDAILDEFKLVDDQNKELNIKNKKCDNDKVSKIHSILLQENNFNIRNFDLDYTLQSLLGATTDAAAAVNNNNGANNNARNNNNRNLIKRKYLFGGDTTNNMTTHRPPHYIGGGMGSKLSIENKPKVYNNNDNIILDDMLLNETKWYEFQYSDVYSTLESEYQTLTSSGDINLLALFLADHPFHARSLLQLSTVLYKTGDADKGKDLLQRCLQVYECAAYHSLFYPNKNNNSTTTTSASAPFTIAPILMDIALEANEPFFVSLFRFMQISSMVGCIPTSFVVARLLLSLDPLRDPMGVLLVLDYYSLACGNEQFLIHLVDSDALQICHEDHVPCPLLTLPNFMFSYALALYRSSDPQYTGRQLNDDLKKQANEALQNAIRAYPSIVSLLLKKNNININSRTTRTDWGGVLAKLPSTNDALLISYPVLQKIIDIFIMKQAPLWSSDNVIQWFYTNCESIASTNDTSCTTHEGKEDIVAPSENISNDNSNISAINRYQSCDPSDYSNTTSTLPAEFNPLDERLVAPALVIDPNRRRLLRQHVQQQQQQQQWMMQDPRMLQQQLGDRYNHIDPDDPMMEIFLRSLMPWNTVQGVPRHNP